MNLYDPDLWEDIAADIYNGHGYLYDTSDMSHMIDIAQIVCESLARIKRDRTHNLDGSPT